MAYRLGGERVEIETDGLTIEVQPIVSDTVYRVAVGLAAVYFGTDVPSEMTAAISKLAEFFCAEAQPTWAVVDHRGVIPATLAGMLRFPDILTLGLVAAWTAAFVEEPEAVETAVDKLVPPGPRRDRLNAQLRAVA